MKFLVDQQLPRRLAGWIKSQGHEAWHVKDIGMRQAEDHEIWREAKTRGAVIVTKDEDFSVIVGAEAGPQVIWVRTGNCSNDVLIARTSALWPALLAEWVQMRASWNCDSGRQGAQWRLQVARAKSAALLPLSL